MKQQQRNALLLRDAHLRTSAKRLHDESEEEINRMRLDAEERLNEGEETTIAADPTLHTAAAWEKRRALRYSAAVRDVLHEWWGVALRTMQLQTSTGAPTPAAFVHDVLRTSAHIERSRSMLQHYACFTFPKDRIWRKWYLIFWHSFWGFCARRSEAKRNYTLDSKLYTLKSLASRLPRDPKLQTEPATSILPLYMGRLPT